MENNDPSDSTTTNVFLKKNFYSEEKWRKISLPQITHVDVTWQRFPLQQRNYVYTTEERVILKQERGNIFLLP